MTAEPATLPIVRLKIERRSSHPWIFQKMVEKPAAQIPTGASWTSSTATASGSAAGSTTATRASPSASSPADPNEPIDAAFFARKIARRGRASPRRAEARRRHRRLPPRPLRGRRAERAGRGPLRPTAGDGVLRRRDVPQREAIQAALSTHFPGCRFYWFAEEHVGKQESFDCRSPEPPPPVTITEHGVRFRVAPGSKHKTGFFLDQRDNRKTLAGFCDGKRGPRPVLQHRRVLRSTPRRSARRRRSSASTSTSRRSRWRSRTPS